MCRPQPTGPSMILALSDGSYCPSASSNNSCTSIRIRTSTKALEEPCAYPLHHEGIGFLKFQRSLFLYNMINIRTIF